MRRPEVIYVPGANGPEFQHFLGRSFDRCRTLRPLPDPVYSRTWEKCPCGQYVVVWVDDAESGSDVGAAGTSPR
jgi:hypothetical protein